jgi:RHS repeat-associated protein
MADHMGNIRNYIHARSTAVDDGSGTGSTYAMVNFTPSANFEYDAFGREVRANGATVATSNTPPGLTAGTPYADALPFHFSSKFTDPESGLNYYGYRYYDPKDGRWLGRDPIGEAGGLNLYGAVDNNPSDKYDFLGLNGCDSAKVCENRDCVSGRSNKDRKGLVNRSPVGGSRGAGIYGIAGILARPIVVPIGKAIGGAAAIGGLLLGGYTLAEIYQLLAIEEVVKRTVTVNCVTTGPSGLGGGFYMCPFKCYLNGVLVLEGRVACGTQPEGTKWDSPWDPEKEYDVDPPPDVHKGWDNGRGWHPKGATGYMPRE